MAYMLGGNNIVNGLALLRRLAKRVFKPVAHGP